MTFVNRNVAWLERTLAEVKAVPAWYSEGALLHHKFQPGHANRKYADVLLVLLFIPATCMPVLRATQFLSTALDSSLFLNKNGWFIHSFIMWCELKRN